uniref:Uncharacterized protein n=1 Tax=Acrobeloides nanus TaxID=290746 RepID=A0A914DDX8_9BILA
MVLPDSIQNSSDENQYRLLKWNLNEEAVLFLRELLDAEAINDLVLFQKSWKIGTRRKTKYSTQSILATTGPTSTFTS